MYPLNHLRRRCLQNRFHLFHLPRRRKFIGWFKYGFLIPDLFNGFVFKFPRQVPLLGLEAV